MRVDLHAEVGQIPVVGGGQVRRRRRVGEGAETPPGAPRRGTRCLRILCCYLLDAGLHPGEPGLDLVRLRRATEPTEPPAAANPSGKMVADLD